MKPDHYLQKAPEDWPRFDLLTRTREFVIRVSVEPAAKLPEVMEWMDRIFIKRKKAGTPDDPLACERYDYYEYIEAVLYSPIRYGSNQ